MTTPDPEPPSNGGLPSRHRPTLGDLTKDTMEMELWALDDDDLTLEEDIDVVPPVIAAPARVESRVPPRREAAAGKFRRDSPVDPNVEKASDAPTAQPAVRIQMNVGKAPQVRRGAAQISGSGKSEADFDDLDQWDDAAGNEDSLNLRQVVENPAVLVGAPAGPGQESAKLAEPQTPQHAPTVDRSIAPAAVAPETNEFSIPVSPSGNPISLRPHLRLSVIERAGIVALGVILLALGLGAYVFSLKRLPSQSLYTDEVEFPVNGSLIAVKDAASYWRVPVLDGPSPDVVRRGTVIIPVVEITTSSGSGAIRAVFRDDAGKTIGDSITHQVQSGGTVKFTSTAGFEDTGMHSAYRAGGGKPWTVEILEGPSAESPKDFKRLFQINLSTATR